MNKTVLLILTSLMSFQSIAMEALSDTDMQQVEGQAGADLSLKLVLNQINANDSYYTTSNAYKFDNGVGGICANLEFCRLALSVNNRYVDAGGAANSVSGNKLWVVFKGIQGTINIQKLGLDGADLVYKNIANQPMIKPAFQLSFDAANPIQIRNFGFNSLSIEKDEFTSKTNADGTVTENSSGAAASQYGYLKANKYAAKPQTTGPNGSTANNYDTGRETGFMGLQMNGNLALQGKIMMFSCDSSMNKRC
ncbi:DUF6160 family protein [Acinetobacter sp.]|jgi:hypothetical protein|uniref:DUF6160 family protein n=1 Tax=Acinetobacter sp. TaxID=472 RepID=UPI00282C5C4D|nr:DUF6160 family protein [Acinetobacter sp.]MDR0236296.1 hypothetical protein [Acinetobacter sp.]